MNEYGYRRGISQKYQVCYSLTMNITGRLPNHNVVFGIHLSELDISRIAFSAQLTTNAKQHY
jgi:hypothetical protein